MQIGIRQKGFSLVEVMLVLVLGTAMLSFLMTRLTDVSEKSRQLRSGDDDGSRNVSIKELRAIAKKKALERNTSLYMGESPSYDKSQQDVSDFARQESELYNFDTKVDSSDYAPPPTATYESDYKSEAYVVERF